MALIGYGTGVGKGLEAADLLAERGLDVTVADARFAKPIDAGLMAQLAAEHELLVTVEEGVLAGGFGSAVWETLNEAGVGAADPARRACPTATSPTASPPCCTTRSATPAERSPSASRPRCCEPRSALTERLSDVGSADARSDPLRRPRQENGPPWSAGRSRGGEMLPCDGSSDR